MQSKRLLASGILGAAFTLSAAWPHQHLLAASSAASSTSIADDALRVYSAGIDRLLVDEKDQGLRTALKMIGPRLAELPDDVGDDDIPGPLLHMVADMLMSPYWMRAGMIEGANPNEGPPFYAQFTFAGTQQQAKERAGMLLELASQGVPGAENAAPSPTMPGIMTFDADGVPMFIGSTEMGGKHVTIAAVNEASLDPVDLSGYDMPDGVEPAFAVTWDAKAIQPFLEGMLQHEPEGEAVAAQLKAMGLMGDQVSTMTFAMGTGADAMHFTMRMTNYADNPLYGMLISDAPLSAEEINLIPADATIAQIARFKLHALDDFLENMMMNVPEEERDGATPQDIYSMIEDKIGIHPKNDLIEHLGETGGFYLSDTTGGSGIMSAVLFLEVRNQAGLTATLNKLTSKANEALKEQADGWVSFRNRTINGQDMMTLSFLGLPVPLEISWAMQGGYLWIAASPQALLGATAHVKAGGPSLLDNANFKAGVPGHLEDAMSVDFADTPRMLRDGYGLSSAMMSALASGVSSRDGSRVADMILPTYPVLAKGARATVGIGWIDGNDFRYHAEADRSVVVNVVGAMGNVSAIYAGAAASIGMGVLLPAIGKARESAQQTKSAVQLRQISMAAITYEQLHEAMPNGTHRLIDGEYITAELLSSPFGPAADGGSDYWLKFKGQQNEMKHDEIIGYDRAMYMASDRVAVVFGDGHVETMYVWDFLDRVEADDDDTDYEIPWN
ncbi:MAG: hypothetical protein ACR2GY_00990 [Phycisphaerales bacterium]